MKKVLHRKALRAVSLGLAAIAAVLFLSQAAMAKTIYLIRDGESVMVHTARTTDPQQALLSAGVVLKEADSYSAEATGSTVDVTIYRRQTVTLLDGGTRETVSSYGSTVEELLRRQGISLGELDEVFPSLDENITDGMEITITRRERKTTTEHTVLPFETVYYTDDSIPAGEEKVLSEGTEGLLSSTIQITYENGREFQRQTIREAIVKEPKAQVVLQGSGQAPAPDTAASYTRSAAPQDNGSTITTASGDVLSYSRTLRVEATAYSCEGYTGTTATGTTARYGAIAVDPSVIPYGTRMYIVSDDGAYVYGYATAEDCGGAIRGNMIDLYFDTIAECYQFGRRNCTVYILD